MNNNRRSLILIIVAIFCLLTYGAYSLFVMPASKKLSELKETSANYEFENQLLLKQLEKSSDVEASFDEQLVQQQLPIWDNTEQVVYALQDIGEKHSLQYEISMYGISETNGIQEIFGVPYFENNNLHDLNVSISLSGTYEKFRSWLDSLQNLERITVVTQFDYNFSNETALVQFKAFFDPSYAPLLKNPMLP